MIDATDLTKAYGPVEALKDVSFHVDAGEIIGLLGPNGAGKTTMMKILTGYLQPSGGSARVDDLDVVSQSLEVQKRIGYLPETAPLYPELSVQAYLRMIANLRQIPEEDQPLLMSEAIRATGLEEHLTRPIGQLSKGYRQRVGLAQAILHKPKLLILDEPTIGLDPTQIVEVRRLIQQLAQDSTILFSTHILSEVEALCDRVIILLNGEIMADARLADLEASTDVILVLSDSGEPGLAKTVLAGLSGLAGVEAIGHSTTPDGLEFHVQAKSGADVLTTDGRDLRSAIYALAGEKGWALLELRRDQRTLETIFNELVTGAGGKEE